MQHLEIIATNSSPQIRFNPDDGSLCIRGESYPENPFEFFEPVMTWLKEWLHSKQKLNVRINISYMNSSSIKAVLDILDILEEGHVQGNAVSVEWLYDAANPRSKDLALEFAEEVTFPFRIQATKS